LYPFNTKDTSTLDNVRKIIAEGLRTLHEPSSLGLAYYGVADTQPRLRTDLWLWIVSHSHTLRTVCCAYCEVGVQPSALQFENSCDIQFLWEHPRGIIFA
jgi:hypothetical protein